MKKRNQKRRAPAGIRLGARDRGGRAPQVRRGLPPRRGHVLLLLIRVVHACLDAQADRDALLAGQDLQPLADALGLRAHGALAALALAAVPRNLATARSDPGAGNLEGV